MATSKLRFKFTNHLTELPDLVEGLVSVSVNEPLEEVDIIVSDPAFAAGAEEIMVAKGYTLDATDPASSLVEAARDELFSVNSLFESGGTDLAIGAIADGQTLVRSGNTVVGSGQPGPGGANTQIQYNNAGAFAGAVGLTTDGTNLTVGGRIDGVASNDLIIRAASNSPVGRDVVIQGGGASTTGGGVRIEGALSINGGPIRFLGGEGGNGNGGGLFYTGGAGGTDDGTGDGGTHTFFGGEGGFDGGFGGSFLFTSGAANGPGSVSGSFMLDIGASTGGGPIGDVLLAPTRGSVGIGDFVVDNSAILELTSASRGFLTTRMTTPERDNISSPATGLQLYNITTNEPEYFNGSVWLATAGSDVSSVTGGTNINVTGPASAPVVSLDGAISVATSIEVGTPANDVLRLTHSATEGFVTNVSGDLTIDNLGTTSDVIVRIGSLTNATKFRVRDTSDNDLLVVDGAGRVGIGTSTPGGNLDIHSTATPATLIVDRTTGKVFSFLAGSSSVLMQFDNSGDFNIASNTAATIRNGASTGFSSRLHIEGGTGQISIGTETPAGGALLTVSSTNRGFMQPRQTTIQRDGISSPANGLSIHNTTTRRPQFFDDSAWQRVSVVGTDTIEIFTAADLDALASGGVITVTSTTVILLRANITTSNRFDVSARFTITNAAQGYSLTYDGAGTFITSTSSSIILEATLVATGGGTLFDVSGRQGDIINVDFQASQGWNMGTVRRSPGVAFGPDVFLLHMAVINWQSTLTLENVSVFTVDEIALIPFAGAGVPFVEIKGVTPGSYSINLVSGSLAAGESLIRVDPGIASASRIIVSGSTLDGILFDIAGGATGAFTAVSDVSVALTTIDSVTDSSGIARFNFTAGPSLFVNQKIDISNFVTQTNYNQTGIITATGPGFFEIATIAFTDDDATGDFSGDSVQISSTAHGLSAGQTLVIDTADGAEYDGGATIYATVANTFRINRAFSITRAGTWNTAGIDQADPRVLATNNPGFVDSKYIAAAFVNDNTTVNGTIVTDTFTDIVFGTGGGGLVEGSTIERWKLIDVINGIFEYVGLEPFDGLITFDFTVESSGGTVDFRFKWEIDEGDGFVDLPDNAEVVAAVGSNAESVTKTFPLRAAKGDQIRPQITRDSGTSTIITRYATVYATQ